MISENRILVINPMCQKCNASVKNLYFSQKLYEKMSRSKDLMKKF